MSTQDTTDSDLKKAMFAVSDSVLGAAVLLALGVYAGSWLDKLWHCSPFLSVGFAILGGGLGLARMIMKAKALDTNKGGKLPKAIGYDDKDRDEPYSFNASSASGKIDSSAGDRKSVQIDNSASRQAKEFDTTKQRLPFEDFD